MVGRSGEARCICACGCLPWQPGEWYGSYVRLMKKSIIPIIHSPHCSGKLEWRLEAFLVAPMTACRYRRRAGGAANPVARWAAMASRYALTGHYFLLTWHGEIATALCIAPGSVVEGGGESNLTARLAVLMDGLNSRLLGARACWPR